ncbi:MAG: DUF1080 domain-containing protein [Chitinophagaceae bacterium]
MQKFSFVLLSATILSACSASHKTSDSGKQNTLTAAEKKEGWQLLFDGNTKQNWHVFNNKTDGAAWKVEDGILFIDPAAKGEKNEHGGDIVTNAAYENFHLKLDWKIDSGGNSGIMFLSQEDPKYRYSHETGPEMQIIDNAAHADAKIVKHRAGDLYDLIASAPENVHPALEWNHIEIIADHGKLQLIQNGAVIVSTTMWDDNWKALIAGSKFKNATGFGMFHSGKIALQDHGNKVWFKNIKIKQL